jgi:hypothetical protein
MRLKVRSLRPASVSDGMVASLSCPNRVSMTEARSQIFMAYRWAVKSKISGKAGEATVSGDVEEWESLNINNPQWRPLPRVIGLAAVAWTLRCPLSLGKVY